ncbi:MAG: hypothetical protein HYY52_03130 [Candidatus Melainabacteria bacterium]|nr:hypothetical protein [Candidatus Melainabacteria bacterium]
MKKHLSKLTSIGLTASLAAIFPFQAGFCCQGKGATCDNEGQVCCPFDEPESNGGTGKTLKCEGIEEYGVGECKIDEKGSEDKG